MCPSTGYGLALYYCCRGEQAAKNTDIKYMSATVRSLRRWWQIHGGCEADLWWSMEGVGVEDGLDHDEGLGQVLPDKVVPVIG